MRYSNRHPPSFSSAPAECASLQNALVGEMPSISPQPRTRPPTRARTSLAARLPLLRSEPSKAREILRNERPESQRHRGVLCLLLPAISGRGERPAYPVCDISFEHGLALSMLSGATHWQ